jgi:SHS2 domain-containing protein
MNNESNKKNDLRNIEFIDITSDAGIKIYAQSVEQLIEIALYGMFKTMCEIQLIKPIIKKEFIYDFKNFDDLDDFFYSILTDILARSEIDEMFFSKFYVEKINNNSKIRVTLKGEKYSSKKSKIHIKAITMHNYHIFKQGKNYKCKVFFDI